MKHVLKKFFFWNTSAHGAFFALTFFIVGSSLWFTFLQMLWLSNCGLVQFTPMTDRCEPEVQVWAIVQLMIVLYSLVVFLRATWLFVQNCRKNHHYRPLYVAFPAMLVWLCGFLFCLLPLSYLYKNFILYEQTKNLLSSLPPDRLGIAYLAAVLCMVAAGFFVVQSMAHAEGVSLRKTPCKAGLALWAVFGIAYLLLLGMAMMQNRQVAVTRSRVEARFGRPLSVDGLREFFGKQGKVDADFWKRLRECQDKLPSELSVGGEKMEDWDGQLPDELTPEWQSAFDDYCKSNHEPLFEMEKCFDSVPPLPRYEFEPGKVNDLMLEASNPSRKFAKWELSRLRVFLKKQDRQNAMLAYQRLANCTEPLQHEPFLIGSLVWLASESIRLDAMERLLESRLLSDDDLRRLAADMVALEERVPVIHQQAMYSEAIFNLDVIWGVAMGKASTIAYAQLRWFYPQLWLQAALDKKYILKMYLAEDFSTMTPTQNTAYILSGALTSAFKKPGNKFHRLTVRTRCMHALLMAESYRREHGDFPAELSDMPTDPFTDKALLYKYGTVDIPEYVCPERDGQEDSFNSFHLEKRIRQVKVVQAWSVGPNGQDDGGIESFTDDKDDPCARIRLE